MLMTANATVVKNLPADAGDTGSIPGLGRAPGEIKWQPIPVSCLGNPMDRGAWWVTVHGMTKSWTRLSTHTRHKLIQVVELLTLWVRPQQGLSCPVFLE